MNHTQIFPSAKIRPLHVRQLVRAVRLGADALTFIVGPTLAALCLLWLTDSLDSYVPEEHRYLYAVTYGSLGVASLSWFWAWKGHYTSRKPGWSVIRDLWMAIVVCALVQLVLMALLKLSISRYFWLLSWGFTFIVLLLERHVVRRLLAKLGLWNKQCVVIGTGPNALDAYKALTSEPRMGFDVQYFYATDAAQQSPVGGISVLHTDTALWAATDADDTQYVIALEYGQENLRDDWIRATTVRGCRAVSVIPGMRGIPLNSTDVSFMFSQDVLILHIRENLQKRSSRVLKRLFDIFGAALLLLMLFPLFVWLWWRIRKDGAAAFYGHERVGRHGQKFPCLKFRSMVPNANEVLNGLLENDPDAKKEWETHFKLKDDPRITPLGHFLRRTSLDELPQLWNVLRGEMSLVGPRPIVRAELERYGKYSDYYLMAKPGMTGLWQVSGRSDVDYSTRVYFDAWYVKNWSLWHDMVILFKTVGVVLHRNGAY